MSSQKWLAVAMTANQTQAGQRSQSALAQRGRTRPAIEMPMISASAPCRLGMAAYGFAASWMSPVPWFSAADSASESTKPHSGNIRGGAVGMSDVADEPDQVRGDQPVADAP